MKKIISGLLILTLVIMTFPMGVWAMFPVVETPGTTEVVVTTDNLENFKNDAGMVCINRDGAHISLIARYLASAVWFEALTGESILESTYVPPADTNLGCHVVASDGTSFYLYGTFVSPDMKYINIMKQIAHNVK